jgi:ABC-type sugar transport system ATPase subunit
MMNEKVILKFNEISKHFGGVTALNNVSFEIFKGECHAVVGENGAGKTTLLNILGGDINPNTGFLELGGQHFDQLDPRKSISLGINVIHQELALIGPLSVTENILIENLQGKYPGFVKNHGKLKETAKSILDMLGCEIDLEELVENLSTSKKQIVEIAKALSTNPKILVMDEPTSSLTQNETENLFNIINALKKRGISIIFVSHRLNEVKRISDRVTVIRDGNYIGTVNTDETNIDEIIRMMVGRKVELYQKRSGQKRKNPIVLEVRNLTHEPYFRDINFLARGGEILSFSGLVGSGRTELAESIFGFLPAVSGEIYVFGKPYHIDSPKVAMSLGIGLLPEDRKINGVIDTMVVRENTSIAVLPNLSNFGFVNKREETKLVKRFVNVLNIKTQTVEEPVTNLSGGNQQKVILARWLAAQVKILMVDEPTQGVDVGAKAEIHKLLRELANQGVAVIVISSDLPEVLSISDRVLVMQAGKLSGELLSSEVSEEKIMTLATVGLNC